MTDTQARSLEEIVQIKRKASEWSSPKGLRTDIVPWRLWEKAKQLMWDPADIDFSQDAKDWQMLDEQQRVMVATLARGFMVGEEGVTLDIVPLLIALSDENRVEEVMYLTTFAFEEAKHVDFFRRWFDAVGFDLDELDRIISENRANEGLPPIDPNRTEGMFESELPRVMRRVLTDRSPQAILDCSITYNQFIEGCLAISGYRIWGNIFDQFGVMPGLREGLRLVRRDEGRHITYGTYLCRRVLAAHPELLDWGRQRMYELRDYYFNTLYNEDGVDQEEVERRLQEDPNAGWILAFRDNVNSQVDARIQVMEKAATLSEEEAEADLEAEQVELELDTVA